jgi:DNA-directed RNA polymerase subunit RPC12/RpoP
MNEATHYIEIACRKCRAKFQHPVVGLDYTHPACPNCGYNVFVDDVTANLFRQAFDELQRKLATEDIERRINQGAAK